MKNFLTTLFFLPVFLFSLHSQADEKFWVEGSDQPQSRVNVDLKALSPRAYYNVSEKVNESVVNISTTQTVKGYQTPFGFQIQPNNPDSSEDENESQNPLSPFFGPFFGMPQAPSTRKEASLGSGFILNRDGYIVTNNHVVSKADEILITFSDETESTAKVIGRDSKTDVALLKVDHVPAKLIPVVLGDSDAMKVGEVVVAIGNPFGLSHSVTQGIISAKERAIGLGPYDDFIQTDASINPGNSGGPLLNLYGEVIGINSAMHAGGQGIGFAIPINSAKDVLIKLKKDGKVLRGQLGVQIQKLTDDHVKALGLPDKNGALVSQVMENSPAEKAGIKAGDVIVSFDEKKIRSWNQLPIMVANTPIGKRAKVEIIRNSTLKAVMVQVGEQKDDEQQYEFQQTLAKDPLGLSTQNLTRDMAQSLGLDQKQKGVLVASVNEDSIAATKGIRRGDVIIEINRQRVTNLQEYADATKNLKKGDSVLLFDCSKTRNVVHRLWLVKYGMMFSMIDYSVIAIIMFFAFFGFLRGVISQVMSVLGFAGVFLFAKPFSEKLDAQVIEFLGSPKPYAKTIALLWAAFIIYVGCRLLGYLFEKFFIKQNTPLKAMNRIGGGFMGAIKGVCIVIVIFYILYLVPADLLDRSAPKVRQSRVYQLMSSHPLFERSYLEGLLSPISRSTEDQIKSLMKMEDPAFLKQMQKAQKTESKMNEKQLLDELNSHLETSAKPAPKKNQNVKE